MATITYVRGSEFYSTTVESAAAPGTARQLRQSGATITSVVNR